MFFGVCKCKFTFASLFLQSGCAKWSNLIMKIFVSNLCDLILHAWSLEYFVMGVKCPTRVLCKTRQFSENFCTCCPCVIYLSCMIEAKWGVAVTWVLSGHCVCFLWSNSPRSVIFYYPLWRRACLSKLMHSLYTFLFTQWNTTIAIFWAMTGYLL